MINHLQWQTFHERRAQAKCTMIYRIVNHQVAIPANFLLPTLHVRGHMAGYLVPFARTSAYQHSFFPNSIRLWNSLPQKAVDAPSLDVFKEASPSRVDRLLILVNTVNSEPTYSQTVYKHECYSVLNITKVRDTPMVDCTILGEEEED